MRDVEIPGGTATFLVTSGEERDEIPGRAVKLIKAATMAAGSQLSDFPEIFEPPAKVKDEGGEERLETSEERQARLGPKLKGIAFSTEQAMAFDNMREATAVALLHSWTLDRRLPTLQTIGDLPDELYNALLEAVGGMSTEEIEDNFDATKMPDLRVLDETSDPTGGSGSSTELLPENPQSTQTPTSQPDTSPSAGEASSPEQ